jgi:hypothetical protein
LCLEGKLRCLRGLPQQGRQDLKHVQISILIIQQVLKEVCQDADPRPGLKLLERMIGDIGREDGLYAWYKHGVYLEMAIPLEHIQQLNIQQWQAFKETRLPQVFKFIQEKRQRYLSLMNQLKSLHYRESIVLLHPTATLFL